MTHGIKHDTGKPPILRGVSHYFPRAIEQVAAVSSFGVRKYAWRNGMTLENAQERYGDALARHLCVDAPNATDDESGLLHAAHAAWNALAYLELLLRANETTEAES